jgi:OOP family OmpA-OmpF porin
VSEPAGFVCWLPNIVLSGGQQALFFDWFVTEQTPPAPIPNLGALMQVRSRNFPGSMSITRDKKMKPMSRFVIAAFAATTLFPAFALAQDSKNQGFLVNAGSGIVKSGTGLCWAHRDADQPSLDDACNPRPIAAVIAPAPVAIVAAPPVQVAAVPAAPVRVSQTQKMSFSGDALFEFDKAVLKPEGKTMLDGLVAKLDGTTYDTIAAFGHTDRIGTNSYNQKLSERRAHAVKAYLESRNVQAGRINATGKGETQPVTKANECLGAKSAKVIACLQPDRRVDVEVTGTRIVTSSR